MVIKAIIALSIVLLLAGCQREQWDDCITSTGPERTEERSTSDFYSVDIDDRIDLVLEHRPSATIGVVAGRNLVDQISTEVIDGVLLIRNENKCNWVRSFKPRITVFVPIQDVEILTLRGAGNVSATDTIRHEAFRIEQWGAMGTADLIVDVMTIHIGLHTGAGDVILKGNAGHETFLYSAMYGTIDAFEMRSQTVHINNSGLGDMRCWTDADLNVQIHYHGDVYYRGAPAISSDITGNGELIKVD